MSVKKESVKRNGKLVVPLTLDDALRAALETPPPSPEKVAGRGQRKTTPSKRPET